MKPLYTSGQHYLPLVFSSLSFISFLSLLLHSSYLVSQSTHSSPSLFPPSPTQFFCLISFCLTLLLPSPLLPFTSSLSTSSLTLTIYSSLFHSFIPKLPPSPTSFFTFSRPSCHLLLFCRSSCSYPPPDSPILSSCSCCVSGSPGV